MHQIPKVQCFRDLDRIYDPNHSVYDTQQERDNTIILRGFSDLQIIGNRKNTNVYLAVNSSNKVVVLKEIYVCNQIQLKQTLNEIRILASIRSKYVAAYLDSFCVGRIIYIIQEYVEGLDLAKIIANNDIILTDNEICEIIEQVLIGLDQMHSVDVIHGDVRLESIVKAAKDNGISCRFVDFEYCRLPDQDQIAQQSDINCAPESLNDKIMDFKTDMWQLGCLIYQLITGKHPFYNQNPKKIQEQIRMVQYKDMKTLQFNGIVQELLQLNPCKRPDCKQVLQKYFPHYQIQNLHGLSCKQEKIRCDDIRILNEELKLFNEKLFGSEYQETNHRRRIRDRDRQQTLLFILISHQ